MKNDYTLIAVVLDRSGSMRSTANATIGGYNEFINGQKAVPGSADLYLAQFDDLYDVVYNGPLALAQDLTPSTFVPRGMTALLDAMGKTITDIGDRLTGIQEQYRPSKVIIVVITDGEENASVHFSRPLINAMVTHQRTMYNWDFVFIGANQDAIATGATLGVPINSSMSYTANSQGIYSTYRSLNDKMSKSRSMAGSYLSFDEVDRTDAMAPQK